MGRDIEDFVHPERISSQLICPICTQVLSRPVMTLAEHLFCEEELLEWLTRSSLCPVTKQPIDPATITRPPRPVLNMLAELQVYCSNRRNGCSWTGCQDLLRGHLENCDFSASVPELRAQLRQQDARIDQLEDAVRVLEGELAATAALLAESNSRLRVYEALATSSAPPPRGPQSGAAVAPSSAGGLHSDAERLRRLQALRIEGEEKGEGARRK